MIDRLLKIRAGIIFTCFFLFCLIAHTSGLQISPVRINFFPEEKITSFKITNLTKQKVTLQSSIKRWQQKQGVDSYTDQDLVFLSPPITSIEPGQMQVFRVALRKNITTNVEQAFRIFLKEVVATSDQDEELPGLHFALQISLPIFIKPIKTIKKDIVWSIKKDKKHLVLMAKNPSNRHVQITGLKLLEKSNNRVPLVDKNVFHYLLAGQSYRWSLDISPEAKQFSDTMQHTLLEAMSDIGMIKSDLPVT